MLSQKKNNNSKIEPSIPRLEIGCTKAPLTGLTLKGLFESAPLYILPDNRGVAPLLAERLSKNNISNAIVDSLPADARSILLHSQSSPYSK